MARSDLLLSLVRAGATGDRSMLRSTVEAIAADERAKRHTTLADRLTRALLTNGTVMQTTTAPTGQPNGKEYLLEATPQKMLTDLVLPSTTRRSIDGLVEEQLRADLLRSHGVQPRHRVLLSGPPGNGKTSLAEAIADALSVPFFTVRYDLLIGSYLGETTQRLRRLFEYIRTTPAVLLFDEFDVVGKERGDPHETGEIKRVVSTLLLQIDALPSYVVVVAATNHGELLDRAVWRRFEVRLELPQPDIEKLGEYFDKAFSSVVHSEITGRAIAERLGVISYAEAQDFVLDIRRKQILSMNELALDQIIAEKIELWSRRVEAPINADRSQPATSSTSKRRISQTDR
jgi:SpoVK/Ycf46/Vps4 family AAA+-type ATPase